jgi:hypothetical protein
MVKETAAARTRRQEDCSRGPGCGTLLFARLGWRRFVFVCAALVPKQIENAPNPLADFTDDELLRLEEWLKSVRSDDGSVSDAGGE